jgi:hypothetical protein
VINTGNAMYATGQATAPFRLATMTAIPMAVPMVTRVATATKGHSPCVGAVTAVIPVLSSPCPLLINARFGFHAKALLKTCVYATAFIYGVGMGSLRTRYQ